MKKFLLKIWNAIRSVFYKIDDEVKLLVPIAIKIVEGLKSVLDGPVDDVVLFIVKSAIPGSADDVLIDKVKAIVERLLPLVLKDLYLIESIAKIDDPNEKLKAVLAQFKLSDDLQKSKVYHDFCYLTLNALSDGKLTLSESIMLGEWYYQNIYKSSIK